jgi:pimeloyl-ACP methyl ester carboxylesterase
MDQWDPEFLDALAKRHRLVVFDPRGVGRSTDTPDDLTVAAMMADAARLITTLRLARPDVLGWSIGGMVAQQLALDRPDLVRRLVLAATSPGTARAAGPTAKALSVATKPGATLAERLALLFPPAHNNVRESYLGRILKRPSIAVPSTTVIARQLSAMTTWMAGETAALPRLGILAKRARVLVAGGAGDIVLPPVNARLIARALPRAEVVVYARAGHGFLFQERARFAPRVLRFLR